MTPFDWQDPFRLQDQLSAEEQLIADSAAAFAQDVLRPRVDDMYANEGVAPELFGLFGEAGLLGARYRRPMVGQKRATLATALSRVK